PNSVLCETLASFASSAFSFFVVPSLIHVAAKFPRAGRRSRHLRDLHRHRRLRDRDSGAARAEPQAWRVADDDWTAVRVVRRDAADGLDADGRVLGPRRPQG